MNLAKNVNLTKMVHLDLINYQGGSYIIFFKSDTSECKNRGIFIYWSTMAGIEKSANAQFRLPCGHTKTTIPQTNQTNSLGLSTMIKNIILLPEQLDILGLH